MSYKTVAIGSEGYNPKTIKAEVEALFAALRVAKRNKKLEKVEHYQGVAAGAIVGLAMTCGFDPEKDLKRLNRLSFSPDTLSSDLLQLITKNENQTPFPILEQFSCYAINKDTGVLDQFKFPIGLADQSELIPAVLRSCGVTPFLDRKFYESGALRFSTEFLEQKQIKETLLLCCVDEENTEQSSTALAQMKGDQIWLSKSLVLFYDWIVPLLTKLSDVILSGVKSLCSQVLGGKDCSTMFSSEPWYPREMNYAATVKKSAKVLKDFDKSNMCLIPLLSKVRGASSTQSVSQQSGTMAAALHFKDAEIKRRYGLIKQALSEIENIMEPNIETKIVVGGSSQQHSTEDRNNNDKLNRPKNPGPYAESNSLVASNSMIKKLRIILPRLLADKQQVRAPLASEAKPAKTYETKRSYDALPSKDKVNADPKGDDAFCMKLASRSVEYCFGGTHQTYLGDIAIEIILRAHQQSSWFHKTHFFGQAYSSTQSLREALQGMGRFIGDQFKKPKCNKKIDKPVRSGDLTKEKPKSQQTGNHPNGEKSQVKRAKRAKAHGGARKKRR